jgi:hypothetical protein
MCWANEVVFCGVQMYDIPLFEEIKNKVISGCWVHTFAAAVSQFFNYTSSVRSWGA